MIAYIILSILLTACTKPTIKSNNTFEGVKLNIDRSDKNLSISKDKQSFDFSYGPSRLDKRVKPLNNNKIPVLAVHLAPAAYRSSAFLSFFRLIEKRKININVISAEGFSTIVAALYAKYQKVNRVEWKLYELYGVLKDEDYLSKNWLNNLETFLDKEFNEVKMNQLSTLIAFPFLIENQLVFRSDQIIKNAIIASLKFDSDQSQSSMLQNTVYFLDQVSNLCRPDLFFNIAVNSKTTKFTVVNKEFKEIYARKFLNLRKNGDQFLFLDSIDVELDKINKISELEKKSKTSAIAIVDKIERDIQAWKKKNN